MKNEDIAVWRSAVEIDKTLRIQQADLPKLDRIVLRSECYTQTKLHTRMAKGEPVVFRDCPVALKGRNGTDPDKALLEMIAAAFPKGERARVKVGKDARMRYLEVPQVLRRWQSGKTVMNVTDLHFRGTKFEKLVESSVLTKNNILRLGTEDMALQEMFTLLISTKGSMSDSHSDDPDGSNHCFIGKKLWLAWDTFEGKSKGLEDVSRDTVETRASFSMSKFLALKSARWFTVGRNETLFLPGKLTHKVLTLENYVGIGCFYVTIPNCLDTLLRWNKYGPLWSLNSRKNNSLVDDIVKATTKTVQKLRLAPTRTQQEWGIDHLRRAIRQIDRKMSSSEKKNLAKNQAFAELISACASC